MDCLEHFVPWYPIIQPGIRVSPCSFSPHLYRQTQHHHITSLHGKASHGDAKQNQVESHSVNLNTVVASAGTNLEDLPTEAEREGCPRVLQIFLLFPEGARHSMIFWKGQQDQTNQIQRSPFPGKRSPAPFHRQALFPPWFHIYECGPQGAKLFSWVQRSEVYWVKPALLWPLRSTGAFEDLNRPWWSSYDFFAAEMALMWSLRSSEL